MNTALMQLTTNNLKEYLYYNGNDWHAGIMANSRVSMALRGFGRTSYHLMEIMQSGLIPVHVYEGTPWIPYTTLFQEQKLGYVSTVEELPVLLQKLRSMSDNEFVEQETRIASYRESNIWQPGILHQISLFMTGKNGGGDLECRALPTSPEMRDGFLCYLPAAPGRPSRELLLIVRPGRIQHCLILSREPTAIHCLVHRLCDYYYMYKRR
jgi:hypothetical protein